jgi:hypothetical protein
MDLRAVTLAAGSRLGPYEILGRIGAGASFPLSTRLRGERVGVRGA